MSQQSARVMIGLLLLAVSTGCSQTTSFLKLDRTPKATKKNPVSEVLGIWEPSEGRGPKGKPRRGCAGQLLFMTYGEKSPVKVDGTVVINTYDNMGSPDDDPSIPFATFKFDAVAWNQHFVEGALGPAYSVFIPYLRDSKAEVDVTIEVEFTSEDGHSIKTKRTKVFIPGESLLPPRETSRLVSKTRTAKITKPQKRRLGESIATMNGNGQFRAIDADDDHESTIQQASYTEKADGGKKSRSEIKASLLAEFQQEIDDVKKQKANMPVESATESTPRIPKRFKLIEK